MLDQETGHIQNQKHINPEERQQIINSTLNSTLNSLIVELNPVNIELESINMQKDRD